MEHPIKKTSILSPSDAKTSDKATQGKHCPYCGKLIKENKNEQKP